VEARANSIEEALLDHRWSPPQHRVHWRAGIGLAVHLRGLPLRGQCRLSTCFPF